ncbi:uncharacterized protein EV154DRAFT_466981 [Mucor mucedo]|uniref:uncharacterized protein n=1 Tax=Mucor mucedo TaxID=29922 RepID=UPI002220C3DA|nr:uncharacterized protein EV154DRAFT_466981 [Mucor mucedo]KAI7889655.1 hypothetical protein EV154DRAFT_466981 [Mucor mucedo]
MYATHNYEFAEMAYGGTSGLFFQRGDPANIRKTKVKQAYQALQRVHSLLARNDLPKLTYALVSYHVSENKKHVGIDKRWVNNALFSINDVNPQCHEPRTLHFAPDHESPTIGMFWNLMLRFNNTSVQKLPRLSTQ